MSFVLFSSMTNVLQFFGIILAALGVAVVTQLIYKKFSDQKLIKDLNSKMKDVRKKTKGVKDPDELMRLNNELMKHNADKMKLIMKPMLFSMLLFVFTFPVWGNIFKGFNLFIFSTSLPVIGNDVGWFLTYIIVSLFTSTIVRRKMGVEV